jgi:hypothetical protein
MAELSASAPVNFSRYNFVVPRDGRAICYNARTGSFIVVDKSVGERLVNKDGLQDLPVETLSFLIDEGVLYVGNEIDLIRLEVEANRHRGTFSNIVLCPTLACNFSCSYCFQNEYRVNDMMHEGVLERIAKFTGDSITQHGVVRLTWFGGEPLLALKKIVSFQRYLRNERPDYLESVAQAIITNGTLLDEKRTKVLLRCGVKQAQVSIDSVDYVQGSKRGVLLNESPSPIVRNVLGAIGLGMKVGIRVNVDALSTDSADDMLHALEKVGLLQFAKLARVDRPGDHAPNEVAKSLTATGSSKCGGCSSCSVGGPDNHSPRSTSSIVWPTLIMRGSKNSSNLLPLAPTLAEPLTVQWWFSHLTAALAAVGVARASPRRKFSIF